MKSFVFVVAGIVWFSGALRAQSPAQAPFDQMMQMARVYEKQNNSSVALGYFREALKKAQNDAERAQAQLGIANHTPKQDSAARLATYQAVLDLAGTPATVKVDARLGMAQAQFEAKQFEAALASLQPIAEMADASAGQKLKARQWSGEVMIALGRFDEARTALAPLPSLENASLEEKILAHRTIARAYLGQNNTAQAQAELSKAAALPGLKDPKIAEIYIGNGDLLVEQKQYALARNAYDKVAVLLDATAQQNVQAKLQRGESFFQEKNYAAAREAWTQALAMRGAEDYARKIWRAIGAAHLAEGNYAATREAYGKWLAVLNENDLAGKVVVWQHVAQTHVQEKNFALAREALSNIGKLVPATIAGPSAVTARAQLQLRQQLDVAEVYRSEGDFDNAAKTYVALLQTVPVGRSDPLYYYDARKAVKTAADEMAREKALMPSLAAAYAVYEALEKLYPYEFDKAQANMGMGDILLAQGKPEEAKAKYQRVMELRKNYDEYKIAQEKIKRIEEGKPN